MSATEITRLVAAPREQYIRKNETRIREIAEASQGDPQVFVHLTAVIWCEGLQAIHESAADRFGRQGAALVAENHRAYAAQAQQIRLHHLDKLAHLLL